MSAGARLAILPLFDGGHDAQIFFELLTRRAGHAAQFNPSPSLASSRIIPLPHLRRRHGFGRSAGRYAISGFLFPPSGRDIRRPDSRDKYSRRRPVNGKKRHSSNRFSPKNETSVFPVDGGHGPHDAAVD
jgi:hypothetical protein